jgi:hypothetical protein
VIFALKFVEPNSAPSATGPTDNPPVLFLRSIMTLALGNPNGDMSGPNTRARLFIPNNDNLQ